MTEIIDKNEQAWQFLDVAFNDLGSSILLYDEEYYPNSVFLLEQSVEKAFKSYDFKFNPNTADPRKIGHKPLQVIKNSHKIYRQKNEDIRQKPEEYAVVVSLTKKIGLDYSKNVEETLDAQAKMDNLIDNCNEFLELDEEDILFIINNLKETHEGWVETINQIQENKINIEEWEHNIDEMYSNIIAGFQELVSKDMISTEDLDAGMKKVEALFLQAKMVPKEVYNNYLLFIFLILGGISLLSLVGLLLSAHEQNSRYPTKDATFTPLDFYTLELPLVSHLPEIQDYVCISLEWLWDAYELLETLPKNVCDDSYTGNP